MKESVGYTVTLNIIIVFIIVTFAFLGFALIYFKANKVTNIITHSIEKHEGYNSCSGVTGCAEEEIISKLSSIGYNMKKINCDAEISTKSKGVTKVCKLMVSSNGYNNGTKYAGGDRGYCIYLCSEDEDYYYYKIKTNMFLDMPIVSAIDVPIYTNTNRLYDFEKALP